MLRPVELDAADQGAKLVCSSIFLWPRASARAGCQEPPFFSRLLCKDIIVPVDGLDSVIHWKQEDLASGQSDLGRRTGPSEGCPLPWTSDGIIRIC